MSAGINVAAVIPAEIDAAIKGYAESKRLSKSHVIREIVIGELSIHEIRSALSKETADK